MAILRNTWKFHDILTAPDGNTQVDQTINFVDADGKAYINMGANITGGHVFLVYSDTEMDPYMVYYAKDGGWVDDTYQTIFFGEGRNVSDRFYAWFTANADRVQNAATIRYNGAALAQLQAGQSAKLHCQGMFMEGDVTVDTFATTLLQEKTVYDNGEVTPDAGYDGLSKVTVAVESGACVEKDVNFYDYDGTLLYAYTVAEAKALTALPDLPQQDGLVCQGWNYDLATIQQYDRAVNVGATYTTDDGKTRLYIHLEAGRTAPMLGLGVNGSVTVDWGDGTPADTLTGTDLSVAVWTPNHAYAQPGDYVIRLDVNGEAAFLGEASTNVYACLLRNDDVADQRNRCYLNALRKLEIGEGIRMIGDAAFYYCAGLRAISIPRGISSIGTKAFQTCYTLACLILPDGVTAIGDYAFYDAATLKCISFPHSLTSIGASMCYCCYTLTNVTLPNGVTTISDKAFYACYNIKNAPLTPYVVTIGSNAFYGCRGFDSITIPNSVMEIGTQSFYQCSNLTDVKIAGSAQVNATIQFVDANGSAYSSLQAEDADDLVFMVYRDTNMDAHQVYHSKSSGWDQQCYKTITFTGAQEVNDKFYSWFLKNAVQQGTKMLCGTWTFNNTLTAPEGDVQVDATINFVDANGTAYINLGANTAGGNPFLVYSDVEMDPYMVYYSADGGWQSDAYKTITFTEAKAVSDSFYAWFTANAKQKGTKTLCGTWTFGSALTAPNTPLYIYTSAFHACNSLASIVLPARTMSIGTSAFNGCHCLSSIVIPWQVDNIGASTFSTCYGMKYYDFTSHTAVPTLGNANAFGNRATDVEIRVPAALYDEWIAATNWANIRASIVAV